MSVKINIVWAATRSDGCVGYFKTKEEIPEQFKYPGEEDITHVMEGYKVKDIDSCLRLMNQHWRSPYAQVIN